MLALALAFHRLKFAWFTACALRRLPSAVLALVTRQTMTALVPTMKALATIIALAIGSSLLTSITLQLLAGCLEHVWHMPSLARQAPLTP